MAQFTFAAGPVCQLAGTSSTRPFPSVISRVAGRTEAGAGDALGAAVALGGGVTAVHADATRQATTNNGRIPF